MDKKALLVRFSSLGDVVLVSSLFDPLISLGYRPFLLTFEPYGELFSDDKRVEVIQIRKDELLKTVNILKGFDLYIDLHKNLRSMLLRLLIRGRWLSYDKQSIRRRLSVTFKVFRKPYNVLESYGKILGVNHIRPKIEVSQERLNLLREKVGEGFIAVGPGARYRKKRYPYFEEVVNKLIGLGFKVVLVGSAEERDLVKHPLALNLCGELSLVDTLAVLKLARLFIGNDSGLLHMARAVKTKVLQIYGGTHPTLGFSVFEDEGKYLIKGLDCQPCDVHGKGKCKYADYRCLEIDPRRIVEEALSLVEPLK
ncbi:glycosyltransferase family 9 protein [Thermocrinis minervae]|uniref:ADP-heptose:LPS heptosyltransferase n=1 Tax=Thermocrinis minervae TaxID=381751 RepID=A0A1M6S8A2_9AQUI|nr:glycosyltransferase family 9 protein [Thermocrinis minervae]SHK40930.1 ADP-heptose:LPS heptosyltransferase [Thermocrinis minervae]